MMANIIEILTEEVSFKDLKVGDVIISPKMVWVNNKEYRYEILKVVDQGTSWIEQYNYISFDNKQFIKEENASDIYDKVVGK